ncbi:EAL domain-containing protein [Altererythrobacter xixiisoli]|uniref:EAL domain-containing protein n=1 Tax=Croceibacterium xixiisoli TaxID=1476466 RepID=A0A6I4TYV6_9SPHN|nr:bifunctional diguanylate cyclase/phosphodiesterase [Croceibacterium xixiisoli]MXO99818.1 EAL domain-containing protein [Croceibacterium xixiisoli]
MAEDRDRLTGLIDADAAVAQIAQWQHAAEGRGEAAPVHAMLLGLKRFAAVNLAFGADAGDRALVEVAERLVHFADSEFDNAWLVARVGGGSFLLVANEACSRERWQWLAEELAQVIGAPILDPGGDTVRPWPRMALLRAGLDEPPERMLLRLGEALERAQHHTDRRIEWVDGDVTVSGRPAQQLEADLLAALNRNEIEILFQPQFASDDGRIVGAEALARWQHPELGRIGADTLFSIAERADHVGQLSRHIARAALRAAASWPEPLRLSLNVTPVDLSLGNFAESIAELVEQAGFSPSRLTLEITEKALVAELDRSAGRLQKLVDVGVRVALDDFGAGFCNFRYLKLLPLHYLKLDRSMVEGITEDARDLAVLRGIVAMAHALDLAVIAEGVENETVRDVIQREGCDSWQGFLGATPLTDGEFRALFAASGKGGATSQPSPPSLPGEQSRSNPSSTETAR